jgi:hypothetical protein
LHHKECSLEQALLAQTSETQQIVQRACATVGFTQDQLALSNLLLLLLLLLQAGFCAAAARLQRLLLLLLLLLLLFEPYHAAYMLAAKPISATVL